MTIEELDFIGSMNMCDEISNKAYEKIICHMNETEPVRCYAKGCAYNDNGICTNDELWIAEEGVCGCFKEIENDDRRKD